MGSAITANATPTSAPPLSAVSFGNRSCFPPRLRQLSSHESPAKDIVSCVLATIKTTPNVYHGEHNKLRRDMPTIYYVIPTHTVPRPVSWRNVIVSIFFLFIIFYGIVVQLSITLLYSSSLPWCHGQALALAPWSGVQILYQAIFFLQSAWMLFG